MIKGTTVGWSAGWVAIGGGSWCSVDRVVLGDFLFSISLLVPEGFSLYARVERLRSFLFWPQPVLNAEVMSGIVDSDGSDVPCLCMVDPSV